MSQNGEPKQPLYSQSSQEELYEATDLTSPEYDNAFNQSVPEPPMDPEEKARQDEEYRRELEKLEDEIHTLRQVLSSKVRAASELKRKLGITPLREFKSDFKSGVQTIKDSDTYQKTNAAFKTAGEKTATAFSAVGAYTSKKLGDVRNSNMFKSFEEKVGGAYTNMKTRVTGSKSENNFEDALSSTVDQSGSTTPDGQEKST